MADQDIQIVVKALDEASAKLASIARETKDVGKSGSEAAPGIKRANDELDKTDGASTKAHGALGKVAGAFGDVAKVAAGFVVGQGLMKLPGFFSDAAKGAAEDEAATLRVQQTLVNLGDSMGLTGQAWVEFENNATAAMTGAIASGQKLAFSDDEIRDSMNFLISATGDMNEALDKNKLAMDISRGAHIDLQSASKLLGKMTDENVQTFKRMGLTFAEGATQQEVLTALQAKFGGQAATFAGSAAGKWEQFNIRMGEVKETIGYALLPVITKIGTVLLDNVMPVMEDFANSAGPIFAQVGDYIQDNVLPVLQQVADFIVTNVLPVVMDLAEYLGPKLQVAADVVMSLAGNFLSMAQTISEKLEGPIKNTIGYLADHQEILAAVAITIGGILAAAFLTWAINAGLAAVATVLAMAPLILIVAAISLVVLGIIELVKHWDDITAKYPFIKTAFDAIKTAAQAVADFFRDRLLPAIKDIWEIFNDKILPVLKTVVEGFITLHVEVVKAVVKMVEEVIEKGKKIIEWFGDLPQHILDGLNSLGSFERMLIGKARDLIVNFLEAIKENAVDLFIWFTNIPQNVLNAIGDLSSTLYNAGRKLVSGLWDGIKDMWDSVKDKVFDIINPANWEPPWGSKLEHGMWKQGRVLGMAFTTGVSDGIAESVPTVLQTTINNLGTDIAGIITGITGKSVEQGGAKDWATLLQHPFYTGSAAEVIGVKSPTAGSYFSETKPFQDVNRPTLTVHIHGVTDIAKEVNSVLEYHFGVGAVQAGVSAQ